MILKKGIYIHNRQIVTSLLLISNSKGMIRSVFSQVKVTSCQGEVVKASPSLFSIFLFKINYFYRTLAPLFPLERTRSVLIESDTAPRSDCKHNLYFMWPVIHRLYLYELLYMVIQVLPFYSPLRWSLCYPHKISYSFLLQP